MTSTAKSALTILALAGLATLSSPAYSDDRLVKARMAAIEGDHAVCAKLADQVRNSHATSWYAHQVYASCKSLDVRKKRTELSLENYQIESMKAIEAIEGIVSNDKFVTSRQRLKFSHMAIEMRKQLAIDLGEIQKQ